jgi:hypothetical protein
MALTDEPKRIVEHDVGDIAEEPVLGKCSMKVATFPPECCVHSNLVTIIQCHLLSKYLHSPVFREQNQECSSLRSHL